MNREDVSEENSDYSNASGSSAETSRKRKNNVTAEEASTTKKQKKTSSKEKVKSKKVSQKYNAKWVEKFPWVMPAKSGDTFFKCKYCTGDYKCKNDGIGAVERHGLTKKHLDAAKSVSQARQIFTMCKSQDDLNTRARKIELMVSMFLIKNDISLDVSDDLIDLIKNIDTDKQVQKKLTCNRTKCTALVKNVIGRYSFEKLIKVLQNQFFSLIIDESTDIATKKNLVLCCRYIDKQTDTTRDAFLALLEVENATHEGLYKIIIDFFEKNEIPYKENMVGFASDGASVMFADTNSVAAKFRKDIPNLFTMKCICHSMARCVSYAVKHIPPEIEEFMTDVHSYMRYSSKRRIELGKLQSLLDIPEHRILKVIKIRWLSLHAAVSRYIEQYDALFKYFEAESKDIHNIVAKRIFDRLRSRWTILYLHFLNFVLPIVNRRNAEFQSESPKIHLLHRKMESLLKTIVGWYMDEDYVDRTDPELLEFEQRTNETQNYWESLRKVDLGPVVSAELSCLPSTIPAKDIDQFRNNCRQFMITLAQQIYSRFPFKQRNIKMLKQISFINPSDIKYHRNISEVAAFFGYDVEEVHQEYKQLKRTFKNEIDMDSTNFWRKVREWQSADETPEFPLIMKIVDRIRVLPHSSANCERCFSEINRNKTKMRSNLSAETISGILHAKALVRDEKVFNVDYEPMLKLFNKNMY